MSSNQKRVKLAPNLSNVNYGASCSKNVPDSPKRQAQKRKNSDTTNDSCTAKRNCDRIIPPPVITRNLAQNRLNKLKYSLQMDLLIRDKITSPEESEIHAMESRHDTSCLEGKQVTVPGGRDKEGRPIILITIPSDSPQIDAVPALQYLLSLFSKTSRSRGLTVLIDARKGPWKVARSCIRQVNAVFVPEELSKLIVLRPDAFWDKQRVENCTSSSNDKQLIFPDFPESDDEDFDNSILDPDNSDGEICTK
ncbi:unnamed protein product [Diabrotica balteata]|uniref:CRAL-TRIO domain-containing protein n=1 Tax=Diabrotica balteata TaxID=107213 RepID=A0A9N9T7C3_DIABA|nr:unnamed protein product [Diabrotica balteata]